MIKFTLYLIYLWLNKIKSFNIFISQFKWFNEDYDHIMIPTRKAVDQNSAWVMCWPHFPVKNYVTVNSVLPE